MKKISGVDYTRGMLYLSREAFLLDGSEENKQEMKKATAAYNHELAFRAFDKERVFVEYEENKYMEENEYKEMLKAEEVKRLEKYRGEYEAMQQQFADYKKIINDVREEMQEEYDKNVITISWLDWWKQYAADSNVIGISTLGKYAERINGYAFSGKTLARDGILNIDYDGVWHVPDEENNTHLYTTNKNSKYYKFTKAGVIYVLEEMAAKPELYTIKDTKYNTETGETYIHEFSFDDAAKECIKRGLIDAEIWKDIKPWAKLSFEEYGEYKEGGYRPLL